MHILFFHLYLTLALILGCSADQEDTGELPTHTDTDDTTEVNSGNPSDVEATDDTEETEE